MLNPDTNTRKEKIKEKHFETRRLMGSVWKIRVVLFVYVSVGVSAHDIGHSCLSCALCARFDGNMNESMCCSPSLVDGCPAPPVERDDNISMECSCKGTPASARFLPLDCFWKKVHAILAFGGSCILCAVAKLMVCTGLARRSKTGQEVSKTRHALVILRSPQVVLSAFVGGIVKFWLLAAHSANVLNCVAVLKGSFTVGIATDLSVFYIFQVDLSAAVDIGYLVGLCILAGAFAAAAFVRKLSFFHGCRSCQDAWFGYYDAFAAGAGCSAGRNSSSSLEGTAP